MLNYAVYDTTNDDTDDDDTDDSGGIYILASRRGSGSSVVNLKC